MSQKHHLNYYPLPVQQALTGHSTEKNTASYDRPKTALATSVNVRRSIREPTHQPSRDRTHPRPRRFMPEMDIGLSSIALADALRHRALACCSSA